MDGNSKPTNDASIDVLVIAVGLTEGASTTIDKNLPENASLVNVKKTSDIEPHLQTSAKYILVYRPFDQPIEEQHLEYGPEIDDNYFPAGHIGGDGSQDSEFINRRITKLLSE